MPASRSKHRFGIVPVGVSHGYTRTETHAEPEETAAYRFKRRLDYKTMKRFPFLYTQQEREEMRREMLAEEKRQLEKLRLAKQEEEEIVKLRKEQAALQGVSSCPRPCSSYFWTNVAASFVGGVLLATLLFLSGRKPMAT